MVKHNTAANTLSSRRVYNRAEKNATEEQRHNCHGKPTNFSAQKLRRLWSAPCLQVYYEDVNVHLRPMAKRLPVPLLCGWPSALRVGFAVLKRTHNERFWEVSPTAGRVKLQKREVMGKARVPWGAGTGLLQSDQIGKPR